jgi:hypothetical protein
VNEATFAREPDPGDPHDRLEGDGDRECCEEDPDHSELARPGKELGQEDGREVAPGLGEDRTALLCLGPELLELAPEDAAQQEDEEGGAEQESEAHQRMGGNVAEVLVERAWHREEEVEVDEGAGDREGDFLDISKVTKVPMFAGRKPFIATPTA